MPASWPKHKRWLKLAKGFRGRAKNCYRIARPRVMKALQHAYKGRKLKKRQARSLWIQRINAGVRSIDHGASYSWFINGMRRGDMELNRKVLSELAITEPFSFRSVYEVAADVSPLAEAKGRSLLVDMDAEFAPGEKERAKRASRHFDPEKEERDKFFEALKAEGIEVIRS
jgi:large subunit ribosomal protein L20